MSTVPNSHTAAKRPANSNTGPSPKRSNNLYAQLDAKLTALRSNFTASGGTFLFSMSDPVDSIRRCIEETGIAGVKDVTDAAGFTDAAKACGYGGADLHRDRLPDELLRRWRTEPWLMDTDEHRRGKNRVWGNCGFAFVYGQKPARGDLLWDEGLEAGKLPYEYQPMHRHNVHWLEQRPQLARLILDLGRMSDAEADAQLPPPMVSWDSSKFVYDAFKGTKKELTKHHADIYSRTTRTHRRQMAIELTNPQQGRARRLVYVPFTNRPEIKALIGRILDKPAIFERAGFVGMDQDEQLCRILERHAVGFDSFHLAVWGDSVVHFEAFTRPSQSAGLAEVADRKLRRGSPAMLVRMVIGTHRPTLTQADLRRLAVACEAGFLPALYHKSVYKKNKVAENVMCAKSTQFHQARSVTEREKAEFAAFQGTDVDTEVARWTPLRREIHGLE